MNFSVSLDNFQGPLDLMLHLIQEHKLDLMDLNLALLAEQYIHFIRLQQNLDDASSYMVEFSRLIEYKSRLILPKQQDQADLQEIEKEYTRRLVEYQTIKELSERLKNAFSRHELFVSRASDERIDQWKSQVLIDFSMPSLNSLLEAYEKTMLSLNSSIQVTAVPYQEISIPEIAAVLFKKIKQTPLAAHEIFNDCSTRQEVVGYFLAVLELIRRGQLICKDGIFYGQDIAAD